MACSAPSAGDPQAADVAATHRGGTDQDDTSDDDMSDDDMNDDDMSDDDMSDDDMSDDDIVGTQGTAGPVLEHIVLDVTDGAAFESAFTEAVRHIEGAQGCRGATLRRCVETEDRYLLLVEWDTLEAHTVGFRESPAFGAWRAEVGEYFTAPPEVEHFVDV